VSAPTPEQLAEWRALADEATEGPWEHITGRSSHRLLAAVTAPNVATGDGSVIAVTVEVLAPDAAFIAATREAVPALIAEVERLRSKVARVETLLGEWRAKQNRNREQYLPGPLPLPAGPGRNVKIETFEPVTELRAALEGGE
jgi:hypothetical protein